MIVLASTYTPIATTTASGSASTITFSSIPSTYTDLVIVLNGNATTGSTGSIALQFNSDTGSNYSYTRLLGDGSAASSARGSNTTATYIGDTGTDRAVFIVSLNNYSNSTTYKTALSRTNTANTATMATVGLWRNTAAINRVDLSTTTSTFAAGSTFTLYGIKAA